MPEFSHERLHVFRKSLVWVRDCEGIARAVPSVHRHLADQLRRAASSVVLNIAEGAGEYAIREKRRFYRMALRSGIEAAAVLSVMEVVGAAVPARLGPAREALSEVTAMLTSLAIGGRSSSTGGSRP